MGSWRFTCLAVRKAAHPIPKDVAACRCSAGGATLAEVGGSFWARVQLPSGGNCALKRAMGVTPFARSRGRLGHLVEGNPFRYRHPSRYDFPAAICGVHDSPAPPLDASCSHGAGRIPVPLVAFAEVPRCESASRTMPSGRLSRPAGVSGGRALCCEDGADLGAWQAS